MIWLEYECEKLTYEEKEKKLENIWKDKEKAYRQELMKRYVNRLEEINQEFVANELFLFSIMTRRIKTAKVFWKRVKVR